MTQLASKDPENYPLAVVKVGGSLYQLPDLGPRLCGWLESLSFPRVLLVPGGGPTADVIRHLDRLHRLGEEKAHWLALRALALNAHFLSYLIPGSRVLPVPGRNWGEAGDGVFILDPYLWARDDEGKPGSLGHSWEVTSDSVAARAAVMAGAQTLILLKSVSVPEGMSWQEAGQAGFVDAHFARVIAGASPALKVHSVNFRDLPASVTK